MPFETPAALPAIASLVRPRAPWTSVAGFWMVYAALLIAVWSWRGLSVCFWTDTLAAIAITTVPGYLLVGAIPIFASRISRVERLAIGSAVGLGVVPLLFVLLRQFDSWRATPYLILALVGVLLLIRIYRGGRATFEVDTPSRWTLPTVLVVVLLFLAFYNFENFRFDSGGNLLTRGLFGVDIPFFIGILPSVREFGIFSDYHQLALPYHYHDHIYLWLGSVANLASSENAGLVAHSAPFYLYSVLGVSLWSFARRVTGSGLTAMFVAAGWLLLGGFFSTEQGTSALSLSFVAGNVLLIAILHVLWIANWEPTQRIRFIYLALALFLIAALVSTKIPTYLSLQAGLAVGCLYLLIKKDWRRGGELVAISLLGVIVLALGSSESSAIRPSGDFLIGAPLMGYGNHLARIFGISVEHLNPVASGLGELTFRHLLILPYTLFHFLRFAAFDGRIIAVALALVILRRRLPDVVAPNTPRWLVWSLVALIPISFALPVLYSPAWYPLAISFYTLLNSFEIAGVLAVMICAGSWRLEDVPGRSVLPYATLLLLVASAVGNFRSLYSEVSGEYLIYPRAAIEALERIRDDSAPAEVIASHRYDLWLSDTLHDEYNHMYSAFAERPVISAGAAYGSMLGAIAVTDTVKGLHPVQAAMDTLRARRAALDSVFHSKSEISVRAALKQYKASYIVEDLVSADTLRVSPIGFADSLIHNSVLRVWRVR